MIVFCSHSLVCVCVCMHASSYSMEVIVDGTCFLFQVNYVVQEAIVVIKDIFRKYPNKYESIISTLCENLDTLDEPEARYCTFPDNLYTLSCWCCSCYLGLDGRMRTLLILPIKQ